MCVEISDVPSGGADFNITVLLGLTNGVKAGEQTVQAKHAKNIEYYN